ncbi:hypothetical protein Slin14017_G105070 [Septoria linicola]|nr:hypothetical protein Slin14017_G105070 [Septoria linicola]
MAWSRADLDRTSHWLHNLERQRVGDGHIPNFVAAATSGSSVSESQKPKTKRTSIPKNTSVNISRAQAKDARKVERQPERRAEQREQGDQFQGLRDSTTGREYTYEQTQFIIACHQNSAAQPATMGQRIPMGELAEQFNGRFQENPPRTKQSLSSVISHKDELKQARARYS